MAALIVVSIITTIWIKNDLQNIVTKGHNELGKLIVDSSNIRGNVKSSEHQQMVNYSDNDTKLILDKLNTLIGLVNGTK